MNAMNKRALALVASLFALSAGSSWDGKTRAAAAPDRLAAYQAHLTMENASPFRARTWRFLGPTNIEGRANDVAVSERSGQRTVYVGWAGSGLWKTSPSTGGWTALFTRAASSSVTAVAVTPSNPDILWLGTGNSFRSHLPVQGAGVYKSEDEGRTWQPMGLSDGGTVSRIVVHPRQADVVYVAAVGRPDVDSPTRGVYQTTDRGRTWKQVFSPGHGVGAFNLVMDAQVPTTLYVSTIWQPAVKNGQPVPKDAGAVSSIFKSTDAGATWREAARGLPTAAFRGSSIGIDVSASRASIAYALVKNTEVDASTGRQKGWEIYRSSDAAENWERVNQGFSGGQWAQQLRVDPRDENLLYALGRSLWISRDGGRTFQAITGPHVDHNGLWIDAQAGTVYDCTDAGLYTYEPSTGSGIVSAAPSTQFYNVQLDDSSPSRIYGSVQDQTSSSAVLVATGAYPVPFDRAPGSEATSHGVVLQNPNIVYASTSTNGVGLSRFDVKAGVARATRTTIVPPVPSGDPPLRGHWVVPIHASRHDPNTVYVGYQYLFRSRDRGDHWERISGDLSDGPLAARSADQCNRSIAAIAESPRQAGLLYVGTDDGRLHVTADAGKSWTELTANLPRKLWVSRVEASAFSDGTVYLTQRGRMNEDFGAYLYRSTNYGRTWESIVGNIPAGPVNVVREDPVSPSVLYAGTDFGVYVSTNGGLRWEVLGGNLPAVPVTDLQVSPRDAVLVISTFGQGIWVIEAPGWQLSKPRGVVVRSVGTDE